MSKKTRASNDSPGSPTFIGADSSFEGIYRGRESICIEGEFKGNIEGTKNVYVHEGARVIADIKASFVMVHGEVNGNIASEENVNIGATGRVNGDVETSSLTVVTGGSLNGQCKMLVKESAAEQRESQGRFGSWKEEVVQANSKEESFMDLETVQTESSSEQEAEKGPTTM
jgi:cytoskeletal protein CcmA (bactofilin family)